MSDNQNTIRHPDIEQELRKHFNEPVLDTFNVVRLVGYGEDHMDCYMIVRRPNPHNDIAWVSCVGGVIYLDLLKEQSKVISHEGEEWNSFNRLDSWLSLNGAPKEDEFIVKIEHHDKPTMGMGDVWDIPVGTSPKSKVVKRQEASNKLSKEEFSTELPIIECPKCHAKAVAFNCSEKGCPVNGGAAYG